MAVDVMDTTPTTPTVALLTLSCIINQVSSKVHLDCENIFFVK